MLSFRRTCKGRASDGEHEVRGSSVGPHLGVCHLWESISRLGWVKEIGWAEDGGSKRSDRIAVNLVWLLVIHRILYRDLSTRMLISDQGTQEIVRELRKLKPLIIRYHYTLADSFAVKTASRNRVNYAASLSRMVCSS